MNTKIQLFSLSVSILVAGIVNTTYAADKIIYPLKEVSKLECRFQDFDTLSSSCKQELPILKTKDYKKYATKDDGYNDFTRFYTVLWGASYTYGWDIGNGWHEGIDIASAAWTPVYSIADGKVIVAKKDIAWGNVVSIEHTIDGKRIVSDYAHLSKIDVEEGESVDVGDKIGEVWSTGNSTWNHLHFQIDLDGAPFYPYYYSYTDCPYSYYEITENGVCFDTLEENTIDPLLFLETSGAALSQIQNLSKSSPTSSSSSTKTNTSWAKSSYTSIFDTYVYLDAGTIDDVKQVQQIYKDLGYYTGKITGNYADILDTILDYQLKTGVITDKSVDGAGYFWPKTRAQTQKDYIAYIVAGGTDNASIAIKETPKETISENKTEVVRETISKQTLMTREEIEKKERDDFLKAYSFDIFNSRELSSIPSNGSLPFTVTLRNKRGSGFDGSTPGNISFKYESDLIDVFPKEFFYFEDGQREIQIKGLKAGTTKLDILFGEEVVKTFRVTVGEGVQNTGITTGKIYMVPNSVVGEAKTGLVVFKDSFGDIMIGKQYEGTFKLESDGEILYCLKKWKVKDVQTVFKKKCEDSQYTSTLNFSYADTLAGLLIFDYKAISQTQTISLKDAPGTKNLSTRAVLTQEPVGLNKEYAYYEEILTTLREGITATGIQRWYFLEDRDLTEAEAYIWIQNTLSQMYFESRDTVLKTQILDTLTKIEEEKPNALKTLTRKEFLELASSYMELSPPWWPPKDYLDLDENEDQKASHFFDEENTWKDEFGKNYFRPNQKITRGEWAYLVALALRKSSEILLTRK